MSYPTAVLLALLTLPLTGQTLFFLPKTTEMAGFSAATQICGKCVALADFNGDGKMDLVFAAMEFTPEDGVLPYLTLLYLGEGDGTFTGPVTISACNDLSGVADVNRDGRQDLICGAFILLGNGDGTFHPGPSVLDGNPSRRIFRFPLR